MCKAKIERNIEICERREKQGISYKKLGEIYNISKTMVIRIVKNKEKWEGKKLSTV